MIVTILTSATDDKLTTVADVKDALDLTDNAADNTLERFIGRASRRIQRFLGRELGVQRYQAVMPAYGGVRLQLPAYPVREILRFYDGTDTGSAAEILSTEYRLDRERGQLNRDEGWPWTWQQGPSITELEPEPGKEYPHYLVEFSAGYLLLGGKDSGSTWDGTTSTGVTLPADYQDACIEMARSMYLSRDRQVGVQSERVGDLSITYSADAGDMPKSVLEILAPLRSLA
jgi:hypothetical protein